MFLVHLEDQQSTKHSEEKEVSSLLKVQETSGK